MTTKKINQGQELSSLLRGLHADQNRKKKKGVGAAPQEYLAEEKVNLELSKRIQAELDPQALAAERKEKIAKLKELIKSGQYNPRSEDVAAALQQDIVFEILSAPDEAANE